MAIVGGGLVGASLAVALAGTRLRVLLTEAVPFDADAQPSFDERTTALGNGSRRILETLGLWAGLAPEAAPIHEIHVSDAGRPGLAHLHAGELGLEAFGYVVPNRVIGRALWHALQARGTEANGAGGRLLVEVPARAQDVRLEADGARLRLRGERGSDHSFLARLAVAADGADSLVRRAAGIGNDVADYRQVAIVARFTAERVARGIAYERFTADGPLAVLPLADGSYGLVWTWASAAVQAALDWSDARFAATLQEALGWRLGTVGRVGPRGAYPLRLSRASTHAGMRCVLIGNAAQALHPVAGQGFNLGLRDAAVLADQLAAAADPGAPDLLERFAHARARDRAGMIGFTDSLVRGFASTRAPLALLRNLGLMLFEQLPPAKQALSRLSWGFGGGAPRLMRGLPVSAGPDAADRPR